jgi:hypothetical protein
MVWVGFCNSEKLTIQIIRNRINSDRYCEILTDHLRFFLEENKENDYIFQQDNAPFLSSCKKHYERVFR